MSTLQTLGYTLPEETVTLGGRRGLCELFYAPGSGEKDPWDLGPDIAVEYSGLTYEAARVERGMQTTLLQGSAGLPARA